MPNDADDRRANRIEFMGGEIIHILSAYLKPHFNTFELSFTTSFSKSGRRS